MNSNDYNVIFAICYAVSAIASVIMIIVTYNIYKSSAVSAKIGTESERYFEHVVIYALKRAEDVKNRLVEIIQKKQEKIKNGSHTTTEIQKENDEIMSFFHMYKRDVSSRLRVFGSKEKKIKSYWEKMDDTLAKSIAPIDPKMLEKEIPSVCELFDKSVIDLKNKKL